MTQDEYFEHEAAKAPKPSNKVLVDREDLRIAVNCFDLAEREFGMSELGKDALKRLTAELDK